MKKKIDINSMKQYIEFLEKRLKSKNYKSNVTSEEYEVTKKKLEKEKLKLKLLS